MFLSLPAYMTSGNYTRVTEYNFEYDNEQNHFRIIKKFSHVH
jgi:hypothetical protein